MHPGTYRNTAVHFMKYGNKFSSTISARSERNVAYMFDGDTVTKGQWACFIVPTYQSWLFNMQTDGLEADGSALWPSSTPFRKQWLTSKIKLPRTSQGANYSWGWLQRPLQNTQLIWLPTTTTLKMLISVMMPTLLMMRTALKMPT